MKFHTPSILVAYSTILVGGLLFASAGCGTRLVTVPVRHAPDPAPISAGQLGKDTTVLSAADRIDTKVKGTPQEVPVAEDTKAIRDGVAAAPAANVVNQFKAYEDDAAANVKLIAQLRADLARALDSTDRVIRIGGYALVALLTIATALSIGLMSSIPLLGPKLSWSLGLATASLFGMLQAYDFTKAHPWITAVSGAFLLIAAVLAYGNHQHDKMAKVAPVPAV